MAHLASAVSAPFLLLAALATAPPAFAQSWDALSGRWAGEAMLDGLGWTRIDLTRVPQADVIDVKAGLGGRRCRMVLAEGEGERAAEPLPMFVNACPEALRLSLSEADPEAGSGVLGVAGAAGGGTLPIMRTAGPLEPSARPDGTTDVLGLELGMSIDEMNAAVEAMEDLASVTPGAPWTAMLNSPGRSAPIGVYVSRLPDGRQTDDFLQVRFDGAPAAEGRVDPAALRAAPARLIARITTPHPAETRPSFDVMTDALSEKYGEPSLVADVSSDRVLEWRWRPDGEPAADPALCSAERPGAQPAHVETLRIFENMPGLRGGTGLGVPVMAGCGVSVVAGSRPTPRAAST